MSTSPNVLYAGESARSIPGEEALDSAYQRIREPVKAVCKVVSLVSLILCTIASILRFNTSVIITLLGLGLSAAFGTSL